MNKKSKMVETKLICNNCPMRRDSFQKSYFVYDDPAKWYEKYFWPNYKLLVCEQQIGKLCLGALVHVKNLYATLMLTPELKEIADQYEEDHELVFSSNGEFIRYHRGEDFGSLDWYRRSMQYIYGEEKKAEAKEDGGQGNLF